MTSFELFKTFHVLAAIVWVGSGIFFNVLMGRLSTGGEMGAVEAITRQTTFVSRYFNVAAVVALLAGIAMVETGTGFGYGDPFIGIGFTGVILSLGIGHGMITPAARDLGEKLTAGDQAGAEALGRRVGMLSTLDSLVLVLVVVAMVVQPFD